MPHMPQSMYQPACVSVELEIAADSAPDTLLSRGRARLIMGAACFVAIVELAWQLHFR